MTATVTTYPMLPTCPARQTGETTQAYGLRVLAFVVAEEVTATLDDEALEQALHASIAVVASKDMHAGALERVQLTRATMSSVLRRRRSDAELEAQIKALRPKAQPKAGKEDDKGQRVPLRRPTPIIPPPRAASF